MRGGKRADFNPATSERDYSDEEREFLVAMERRKRELGKTFLTVTQVLAVAKSLGYRKVAEPESRP